MDKVEKFAGAIFAIAQNGHLDDRDLRPVVRMLIRESTATSWPHATADFRSRSAARVLEKFEINSRGEYHLTCHKHLYLDHAVPAFEILELIKSLPELNIGSIASTLRKFALHATISPDELELFRVRSCQYSMPASFWDPDSSLFMNPLARYIESGLRIELIERNADSWLFV